MKEPSVGHHKGELISKPYSQAPTDALLVRAANGYSFTKAESWAGDDQFFNPEFRRMYAARLLRERGL